MFSLKNRVFEVSAVSTWVLGYLASFYVGLLSWPAVLSGSVMLVALIARHWQHWTQRHKTGQLSAFFLLKIFCHSVLLLLVVAALYRHAFWFTLVVALMSAYYSVYACKLYFDQPVFRDRKQPFGGL